MFGDIMGKMQEAQQKMEATKKRLDTILIDEILENGLIKITCTANKKIKNIIISQELMDDKESVEDLIIVAINRALEKAEKISEIEMKGVANNVMPDIQNMFG